MAWSAHEDENRRLLRARDAMDRSYAEPLDVPSLAALAFMSPAHFTRRFNAAFGEPPHRYLQRRRIERAMALLRQTDVPVTEICLEVGFSSLGTFSRTFAGIVGQSPSAFRGRTRSEPARPVPTCYVMAAERPRDRAVSEKPIAAPQA